MTRPALKPVSSTHIHVAGEVCPWCEQPIPEDQAEKVRARIMEREEQQKAEQEARFRREFTTKVAEVEKRSEADKAAAVAKTREDAEKESAKAINQVKMDAVRKAEVIRAAATQAAKAESAQQIEAASQAAAKAKSAAADAEAKLEANKESSNAELVKRLAEQRDALEKDKTASVLASEKKAFDDRQKLEATVEKLKRQVKNQTAAELGEGAELDLFEVLKTTFEDDRIRKVGRGKPGADIIHEVVENGKLCGKIVYDSKNHNAWRGDHAVKLRRDQIAEKAHHSILSTNKFPAGAHQLDLREGVILACPARVPALAELLRSHIVSTYGLRVSNEEREEKTAALYAFITSERCRQLLDTVESLIAKLEGIEVAEQKAHSAVWEKRGKLLRSTLKSHADLCFEINRIIGTTDTAS